MGGLRDEIAYLEYGKKYAELSACIKHLTPSNFGCINTGLL